MSDSLTRDTIKQASAELIGSAFFTLFGAGVIATTGNMGLESVKNDRVVFLALSDGFLFYVMVYLTMTLSRDRGGYLNPAVTLGLVCLDSSFSARKIGFILSRGALFIASQFVGSLLGAFLLLVSMPDPLQGSENTGVSAPALGATNASALVLEIISGFFLVLVVLAVRRYETRRSSLILAFVYAAIRLVSFPITNGFANPARSFGPAVVGGQLHTYWMYLIGAPIGAIAGVMLFTYLHKATVEMDTRFQDDDDDDEEA